MTLTLGLASVFMMNGSLQNSNEIFVNLPLVESSSPIIVYPETDKFFPTLGGGGSGGFVKCNRKSSSSEKLKKLESKK
jgi:hypothetical protein